MFEPAYLKGSRLGIHHLRDGVTCRYRAVRFADEDTRMYGARRTCRHWTLDAHAVYKFMVRPNRVVLEHVVLVGRDEGLGVIVPCLRQDEHATAGRESRVKCGGAEVIEAVIAVGCRCGDELWAGWVAGLEGEDVGVADLFVEPGLRSEFFELVRSGLREHAWS